MKISAQCKICGKSFVTDTWKQKHGRGIYCSRDCYKVGYAQHIETNNPNPRNRITKSCESCGAQIEVQPCNLERKRFCSRKCAYAWKRTITGENHPLYTKITKQCEWCGNEYTCKHVHKNKSRFCSMTCLGTWFAANFPKGQTSIEKAIAELLNELGLPYVEQKQMGVFLCDFVLKKYRLAIECDGIYWHSTDKQKAKDERKDTWLRNHGYNILRLSEPDIKQRLDWCKEQILAAITSSPPP